MLLMNKLLRIRPINLTSHSTPDPDEIAARTQACQKVVDDAVAAGGSLVNRFRGMGTNYVQQVGDRRNLLRTSHGSTRTPPAPADDNSPSNPTENRESLAWAVLRAKADQLKDLGTCFQLKLIEDHLPLSSLMKLPIFSASNILKGRFLPPFLLRRLTLMSYPKLRPLILISNRHKNLLQLSVPKLLKTHSSLKLSLLRSLFLYHGQSGVRSFWINFRFREAFCFHGENL